MRLRRCDRLRSYTGGQLSQAAACELIRHELETAGVKSPFPPLASKRRLKEDRRYAVEELGDGATPAEIASLVAALYSRRSRREKRRLDAATTQLRRLLKEAQEWEYVHVGSEEITGRKPLPRARGGPPAMPERPRPLTVAEYDADKAARVAREHLRVTRQ
jgi:hypothetical protein